MKILLVDDESRKLKAILKILSAIDGISEANIERALDLNRAKILIQKTQYDILILDINMPEALGEDPNETAGFDFIDELIAVVTPSIESSIYVKSLKEKADVLRRVAVGQPFTDFTLNDPDGNPLPLSSVVGENYVLIDFWAS